VTTEDLLTKVVELLVHVSRVARAPEGALDDEEAEEALEPQIDGVGQRVRGRIAAGGVDHGLAERVEIRARERGLAVARLGRAIVLVEAAERLPFFAGSTMAHDQSTSQTL